MMASTVELSLEELPVKEPPAKEPPVVIAPPAGEPPTVEWTDMKLHSTARALEDELDNTQRTVRVLTVGFLERMAAWFIEAQSGERFSDMLGVRYDYGLTVEDVCTLLHGNPIRRCGRSFMLVPIDAAKCAFLTDATYDVLEDMITMLRKIHHEDEKCGQWTDV